jgi:hypothetical protein
MRRALALAAALLAIAAAALTLTPASANADYRGSDPFSNIAPPPQVGGAVDQYPLSAYGLDSHVDVSLSHPQGVPSEIAQEVANFLWTITTWMMMGVIDLLMFAFSLNLLNGSNGHGGALGPVSDSIANLYNSVVGSVWLHVAITVGSFWLIWEGLVKRRYADASVQLGSTVAFIMVGLTLIFYPQETVGRISIWVDEIALEVLAGSNGTVAQTPEQAKQVAAAHLFNNFIRVPWKVLEFGGLKQCVNPDKKDSDGFPVSVAPGTRGAKCYDTEKYADRFLRYPIDSEARNAEYTALETAAIPDRDTINTGTARGGNVPTPVVQPLDAHQFDGYTVEKGEAHAVDIQQQGGAWGRVALALMIFIQALGVVLMFGTLALGIILAGVVFLLLLGFVAFTILAACVPRWGHQAFRTWLGKGFIALVAKLGFSCVAAVLTAIFFGLTVATANLGFLMSFGIQCAMAWIAFAKRETLFGWWFRNDSHGGFLQRTARLLAIRQVLRHTTGNHGHVRVPRSDLFTENNDAAKSQGPDDPYTQTPAPTPEERIPEVDLRSAQPPPEDDKFYPNGAPGRNGKRNGKHDDTVVMTPTRTDQQQNGDEAKQETLEHYYDLTHAASRLEHAALALERAVGNGREHTNGPGGTVPASTVQESPRGKFDDSRTWDEDVGKSDEKLIWDEGLEESDDHAE